MAYFGRVVAVGLTRDKRPAAIYGISGRSEGSKKRRLVQETYEGMDGGGLPCIRVREVGELTPDQKERSEIFFYPAIVTRKASPVAVVSNGDHTDRIAKFLNQARGEWGQYLQHGLRDSECEPDRYSTPRLAGMIHPTGTGSGCETYNIEVAKIAKRDTTRIIREIREITPGRFFFASTYLGSGDEPNIPARGRMWAEDLDAKTPQELADHLYEWFDEDKRVATGAAVNLDIVNGWQLAVRNLHG